MTEKVRLGNSDLYVHPIGLGTNAVGGHNLYPNLDEEEGKMLVKTAVDHGITMIDTAYMYGVGRSEELIGEVLKHHDLRQEVVIATKISPIITEEGVRHNNTPAFLREETERSLLRLQTDYIDLMYIHYPDEATPKAEAIGELYRLKEEGKIRAIGVSNFSLPQLKEANADGHVDVFQGKYNLFDRGAESELFPYVADQGISFIPYFPLASGLLTGKYKGHETFEDLRAGNPLFKGDTFKKNAAKVHQLRPIAEAKGVDIAHLVLAWYLTYDIIDVIIPGAKTSEQVLDNLETVNVQLTDEEIREIDRIFN